MFREVVGLRSERDRDPEPFGAERVFRAGRVLGSGFLMTFRFVVSAGNRPRQILHLACEDENWAVSPVRL